MNKELLEKVKERIEALAPERKRELDDYSWGDYKKIPGTRGVFFLEDGWYTYLISDRAETVFTGPINNEDLFGYICETEFGIDAKDQSLDFDRTFEIMNSKFNSIEEIQTNIKKKLYEMKKEIIEQKIGESKDSPSPNM